ncbi:asparagine synthase-related protein [Asticcacaulis taihuensis]|uniref:asparagine synthase (glutamine-hydrolyzing) n=1 Tax=Asticcacaulis taihuensis TaxID=260084 RepID=A0A1G4PVG6_9CAUL|nr:asparagine synthase-related protein [Asticcacaulis taihuensis]SCW36098.1 asparagine synthase (glutamine-hydrolysing) [Asticcacaulis taihuensis]
MTRRYLVVLNKTANDVPFTAPSGFIQVHRLRNVVVWADNATNVLGFESENAIVIGHLFPKAHNAAPLRELPCDASQQITRTQGQVLIDQYWGGYCYFQIDSPAMGLFVVRDPSGMMPCYWHEGATHWVLASDAETLAKALGRRPEIDWSMLRRHLHAYDLRSARTCLENVTEVLPGQRLHLTPTSSTVETCWSPWAFTRPTRPASPQDLRETVDACVQTWANAFSRILLTVSGGLDSSICTAALRDAPNLYACLTMTTDEAEGDETPYARLLAGTFNRRLIEARHELSDIDFTRTSSGHLPRPVNYALGQSELRHRRVLAEAEGLDAIFTGVGGDNVFCHVRSATPVVDRLIAQGIMGAFAATLDICRMTDASLSEVIQAARERRKRSAAYTWHVDDSFLTGQISLTLYHPWLEYPSAALPGKAVHIAMLERLQATTDGYDPATWPQQVNPLASQPIMELCLGIPSWRWCAGGRDRSVARAAYSDILPAALINRRSKGGANSFAHQIVSRRREDLRMFLCAGLLAEHQVIDARSLDVALAPSRDIPFSEHLRLLFLAEAESWARHWMCIT